MLHDGFGGLIGSVNVPSEYFIYLKNISEGDRCVFILKNKFDRQDYYYTEIDREYIFFKKSDLIKCIKNALESESKIYSDTIEGIRIIDNVIWEDSIPCGLCAKGPIVNDVLINLTIDLNKEDPTYQINIV